MKGNILFFKVTFICPFCSFGAVELFDDGSHRGVDLLVTHDFLGRVHDENVRSRIGSEHMLLLTPALSYPSLQQVALDCALERFLWNRYHKAGVLQTVFCKEQISQSENIAMLSFGKKI